MEKLRSQTHSGSAAGDTDGLLTPPTQQRPEAEGEGLIPNLGGPRSYLMSSGWRMLVQRRRRRLPGATRWWLRAATAGLQEKVSVKIHPGAGGAGPRPGLTLPCGLPTRADHHPGSPERQPPRPRPYPAIPLRLHRARRELGAGDTAQPPHGLPLTERPKTRPPTSPWGLPRGVNSVPTGLAKLLSGRPPPHPLQPGLPCRPELKNYQWLPAAWRTTFPVHEGVQFRECVPKSNLFMSPTKLA